MKASGHTFQESIGSRRLFQAILSAFTSEVEIVGEKHPFWGHFGGNFFCKCPETAPKMVIRHFTEGVSVQLHNPTWSTVKKKDYMIRIGNVGKMFQIFHHKKKGKILISKMLILRKKSQKYANLRPGRGQKCFFRYT